MVNANKKVGVVVLVVLSCMVGCGVDGAPSDHGESTTDDVARSKKIPFVGAHRVDPGMRASGSFAALPLAAGDAFGPFEFVADHSGKCLDVTGGPGAIGNGVPIQQWDCFSPRRSNQQWFLVDTGDVDSWYIVAQNSGRCLDVVGGTGATGNGVGVQQFDCLGYAQSNQRWILQSNRNITAVHSGKCLDVRGGPTAVGNGAAMQQWSCFAPTTANQRWSLE